MIDSIQQARSLLDYVWQNGFAIKGVNLYGDDAHAQLTFICKHGSAITVLTDGYGGGAIEAKAHIAGTAAHLRLAFNRKVPGGYEIRKPTGQTAVNGSKCSRNLGGGNAAKEFGTLIEMVSTDHAVMLSHPDEPNRYYESVSILIDALPKLVELGVAQGEAETPHPNEATAKRVKSLAAQKGVDIKMFNAAYGTQTTFPQIDDMIDAKEQGYKFVLSAGNRGGHRNEDLNEVLAWIEGLPPIAAQSVAAQSVATQPVAAPKQKKPQAEVRTAMLAIASINLNRCIRDVDQEHVKVLAASIATYGLLSPIACAEYAGVSYLISGRHRLEACKILKESSISAIIIPVVEEDAIDAAIDANVLTRLSPLDRAMHLQQAAQEYDRRFGGHGIGTTKGKDEKFSSFISERFGLTIRSCQRALSIASMPDTTLRMLAGSPVKNNEGKLYAISRIKDLNDQAVIAIELQEHPKKTLRQAMLDNGIIKAPAPTPANAQLDELNRLWAKADASVRTSFYEAHSGDFHNIAMAKVK